MNQMQDGVKEVLTGKSGVYIWSTLEIYCHQLILDSSNKQTLFRQLHTDREFGRRWAGFGWCLSTNAETYLYLNKKLKVKAIALPYHLYFVMHQVSLSKIRQVSVFQI